MQQLYIYATDALLIYLFIYLTLIQINDGLTFVEFLFYLVADELLFYLTVPFS